MTVRIGFLGGGLIATYHGKSLRRSGADHVIAAVYDVDPERTASFAKASGAEPMASEAAVLDAVALRAHVVVDGIYRSAEAGGEPVDLAG